MSLLNSSTSHLEFYKSNALYFGCDKAADNLERVLDTTRKEHK